MNMTIYGLHMCAFYILIVNIFPRDIHLLGRYFVSLVAIQLSWWFGFELQKQDFTGNVHIVLFRIKGNCT